MSDGNAWLSNILQRQVTDDVILISDTEDCVSDILVSICMLAI